MDIPSPDRPAKQSKPERVGKPLTTPDANHAEYDHVMGEFRGVADAHGFATSRDLISP